MTTIKELREQTGPATTLECILADAILDAISSLEQGVSEGLELDAQELWEAAEGGDEREIYRAGMICKAAIDDESFLGYTERLKLACWATAITYAALERF